MAVCVCLHVFEVVAGGAPVKTPQESSRRSKEASEAELGDVETGSSASGDWDSEGQTCLSRRRRTSTPTQLFQ